MFKKSDRKMDQCIQATLHNDMISKSSIYQHYRKDQELALKALDRGRMKIEKGNLPRKNQRLKMNTLAKMAILVRVLKQTLLHLKTMYYESDNLRFVKLFQIQKGNFRTKKEDIDEVNLDIGKR